MLDWKEKFACTYIQWLGRYWALCIAVAMVHLQLTICGAFGTIQWLLRCAWEWLLNNGSIPFGSFKWLSKIVRVGFLQIVPPLPNYNPPHPCCKQPGYATNRDITICWYRCIHRAMCHMWKQNVMKKVYEFFKRKHGILLVHIHPRGGYFKVKTNCWCAFSAI